MSFSQSYNKKVEVRTSTDHRSLFKFILYLFVECAYKRSIRKISICRVTRSGFVLRRVITITTNLEQILKKQLSLKATLIGLKCMEKFVYSSISGEVRGEFQNIIRLVWFATQFVKVVQTL